MRNRRERVSRVHAGLVVRVPLVRAAPPAPHSVSVRVSSSCVRADEESHLKQYTLNDLQFPGHCELPGLTGCQATSASRSESTRTLQNHHLVAQPTRLRPASPHAPTPEAAEVRCESQSCRRFIGPLRGYSRKCVRYVVATAPAERALPPQSTYRVRGTQV